MHVLSTTSEREVCRVFVLLVCCEGGEGSGAGGKACALLLCTQASARNAARLPPTERRAGGERVRGRAPVAMPCHGGWQSRVPKVAGAKGGWRTGGGGSSGVSLVSLVASLLSLAGTCSCCARSGLLLLLRRYVSAAALALSRASLSLPLSRASLALALSLASLPLPLTCSSSPPSHLLHIHPPSNFHESRFNTP